MHPFTSVCIWSAQLTAEPVHPIPALAIVGGLISPMLCGALWFFVNWMHIMWLQCVSTCVRTYVQYVSVYLCMCVHVVRV